MDDDEVHVSYQGVPLGVPVLTRDGEQIGILEHVLEVPELDIFEGIIIWTGHGNLADRLIQRDLSMGAKAEAAVIEALQPDKLRFVHADKIAAITVGYVRCDLNWSEAAALPPPDSGAPAYYANAIDQAGPHSVYGRLFRRPRWSREK